MESPLRCQGIWKAFERSVVPSALLQDHLLKRTLRREQWRMDVLKNISLELRRGEWLGLYGHNGSGKTTLLRILAGLLRPNKGRVISHGSISCFFALGAGFHLERCAEENIRFHGLLRGMSDRAIRSLSDSIFAFADIDSHRDLPIKCYSTGMIQRLAFASAIHTDADIYLMDEIFAVGDTQFQEKCWSLLQERKAQGKSVILVSHQLGDLHRICDRVVVLDHGALIEE